LAQLQLNAAQQKEKAQPQQTCSGKDSPAQETVHIIVSGSENFSITQDMLQMDEETMQK
jgi:hypothetical protein